MATRHKVTLSLLVMFWATIAFVSLCEPIHSGWSALYGAVLGWFSYGIGQAVEERDK